MGLLRDRAVDSDQASKPRAHATRARLVGGASSWGLAAQSSGRIRPSAAFCGRVVRHRRLVGGKTLAKLKPFGFRIFKKTSPNKTFGGLVVSFVLGGVAWVWVFGGGLLFGDPTANLNLMAYLGLAAFAVLGDWLASKLKRLAKVKGFKTGSSLL